MSDSQHQCYALLEETISLAQADPISLRSLQRLQFLISSYFQNDTAGACFRSMICHGRGDILVSTEDFNKFVVLPMSHFAMELLFVSSCSCA
jgi:hypothetical protein